MRADKSTIISLLILAVLLSSGAAAFQIFFSKELMETEELKKIEYRMFNEKETASLEDWQNFKLIDQNNETFSLQDFKEIPVIFGFVFAGCTRYCPIQTGSLQYIRKKLIKELGHSDFKMVSISLTPDFDSPSTLKRFADQFSANLNNWHFATGDPAEVQALIDKFEVHVQRGKRKKDLLHSTDIFILDRENKLHTRLEGIPLDNQKLKDTLLSFYN